MADLYKYATAVHIYKPIIKRGVADFAVGADWIPAAGDVKISIDGGAAANVTNLPVAVTMGNTALWDFSLTTGEITGKKIRITVADSATKAVEDNAFEIDTYGHASAQHVADFSQPYISPGTGTNQLIVSAGIATVNVTQRLGLAEKPRYVGAVLSGSTSTTLNVTPGTQVIPGDTFEIIEGTGIGQEVVATDYNPVTGVVTIFDHWPQTIPSTDSVYERSPGPGIPSTPADTWSDTECPDRRNTADPVSSVISTVVQAIQTIVQKFGFSGTNKVQVSLHEIKDRDTGSGKPYDTSA
jgi:hypothetical protein